MVNASGSEFLESIVLENPSKCPKSYFQNLQSSIDGTKFNHLSSHPSSPKPQDPKEKDYRTETALEAVLSRGGWLFLFFVGLIFAAMIIELFDEIIERNVELSYFVPLLIGHGGNSGSQSVATVIRAIALGNLGTKDFYWVLVKESLIGGCIGMFLGTFILCGSFLYRGISSGVGLTVAVALPLVSIFSNMLGGLCPLIALKLGYNPAFTSAPLMSTLVDSVGLGIYFWVAKFILDIQ